MGDGNMAVDLIGGAGVAKLADPGATEAAAKSDSSAINRF
jgi:hypothetical protein